MTGRLVAALLLAATSGLAQNAPTFTYSSQVQILAIATDSASNTYLTGTAQPGAIATTPGAFQSQDNSTGICEIVFPGVPISCIGSFVEKLDPTGAVVFATYLSGSGDTTATAIAVDQQGNVYVGGRTSPQVGIANTFPVTPGAAFTNSGAGFIVKLNPSGTQLVYSTFIPAGVGALAVDLEGNVYFTSTEFGPAFPTTPGAFQVSPKSSTNLFPSIVAKLNASGSELVYATYLSGSATMNGGDDLASIAVDDAGDAFITGSTFSPDFPVTPGAFLTTNPGAPAFAFLNGNPSVFLTKLNPQGSGLVFSTFLGEGGARFVKLDAQGTAFLGGSTNPLAALFPTTPGANTSTSGNVAGFLTRLSADGTSLIYSTYLSTGFSIGVALDVDSAGNAVVAGTAASSGYPNDPYMNLPVGVGAFQPGYAGGTSDVYVERFTPEGRFAGATYLGGSQADGASLIAFAPNGSVVIAGSTQSPDFPGIAQPVPSAGLVFVTSVFMSLTAQNAGSYVAAEIAPGEIVALRGYGIGPATGVNAAGPALPTQLAGVQVSIGGFAAPLYYVQSDQINAQVPWELAGQTSAAVQIIYHGVPSTGTPVVVTLSMPGIFYIENSDGSFNSPSNPARAGDYVSVYGTGGGAMSPPGVAGQLWPLAPLLSLLTQPVSVTVGGEGAGVLYSGSAPTLESGFFQINVRLPSDLAAGAQALSVTIGGVASAPAAISIQ